jgi:hypothetical protein
MNWLQSTNMVVPQARRFDRAAGNQRPRAHAITTTCAMPMNALNQLNTNRDSGPLTTAM